MKKSCKLIIELNQEILQEKLLNQKKFREKLTSDGKKKNRTKKEKKKAKLKVSNIINLE